MLKVKVVLVPGVGLESAVVAHRPVVLVLPDTYVRNMHQYVDFLMYVEKRTCFLCAFLHDTILSKVPFFGIQVKFFLKDLYAHFQHIRADSRG